MFGKIKYWNKYKNSYINRLQKMSNTKQIVFKIFELNYGNAKLSNICKYKRVRLILAVFASCLFVLNKFGAITK